MTNYLLFLLIAFSVAALSGLGVYGALASSAPNGSTQEKRRGRIVFWAVLGIFLGGHALMSAW